MYTYIYRYISIPVKYLIAICQLNSEERDTGSVTARIQIQISRGKEGAAGRIHAARSCSSGGGYRAGGK